MGYRDDREALREQVDELRREVEALRGITERGGATLVRVESLAQEVNLALDRMEKDREVLKRLATSLAALKDEAKKKDGDDDRDHDRDGNKPPLFSTRGSSPGEKATPHHPHDHTSDSSNSRPFLKFFSLLVLLVVGMGAAFMATRGGPDPKPNASSPSTSTLLNDLPGGPHHVDPLALLGRAEALAAAPGVQLTSIDAWYVSEDGTLDLLAKTYEAHVTFHYEGVAPAAPPIDPSIPLGAPRPSPPNTPHYCVMLNRSGGLHTCNAAFLVDPPVPKPHCTTREVWATARAAGAPAGAVAHLTYKHEPWNKAPLWTFHIEHTKEAYEIADHDCRVSSRSRL